MPEPAIYARLSADAVKVALGECGPVVDARPERRMAGNRSYGDRFTAAERMTVDEVGERCVCRKARQRHLSGPLLRRGKQITSKY